MAESTQLIKYVRSLHKLLRSGSAVLEPQRRVGVECKVSRLVNVVLMLCLSRDGSSSSLSCTQIKIAVRRSKFYGSLITLIVSASCDLRLDLMRVDPLPLTCSQSSMLYGGTTTASALPFKFDLHLTCAMQDHTDVRTSMP